MAAIRTDREWGGFSLIELTIVLVLAALSLAVALFVFSSYLERSTARRAAQIFARDLALARSSAVRGREWITVRFFESDRRYSVNSESGRELARRSFGDGADLTLSAIDLALPGDTLRFDARGVGDLSGGVTTLGEAVFTAGETAYRVAFNAMGGSRVSEN